jgi:branched-chain amino acid transport system substrate-binding protein
MKRRIFVATTIALGLATSFAGQSAFAGEKVAKLGFSAVLSGAHGHYGKDMEYAAKIAVDEANAKKFQIGNDTLKFELLSEDDQADPKAGAAAAQRLVDAGVTAVIGHFNSGTSIPASRIYHAAGIPQVSPAATNPILTGQGYKSVFRVINTDAQLGSYAGKFAVKERACQRIGVIDDRTAFGVGMADEFTKAVRAAKGNIVAREYTNDKAVDFTAILTNFKNKKVDCVFFGGLDAQAGPMGRQLHQLQLGAVLMGGGGFTNKKYIDASGPGAEGTLSWEYGLPLAKMPGGKALIEKMKTRYNVETEHFAPFSYDATWVVINAIVNAKSTDPKVFLPVLAATNFDGATGKIKFDSKGDLIDPPATLFEVKNGEWVPLRTVTGM